MATKTIPRPKTRLRARGKAKAKNAQKSLPADPEVITVESWTRLPWLVHGFSTRPGGLSKAYGGSSLNLGLTKEDRRETVERNREVFLQSLGAVARGAPGRRAVTRGAVAKKKVSMPLVTLRQIHSDLVHAVCGMPKSLLVGDGAVTRTPGLVLGVQTADCLPVILVDPKRKAVGVFHAGWRGTLRRIVEKGVGEMRRNFGCEPRDLEAAIGPGIRQCCFEVGPEVRARFEAQFAYGGKLFREVKELDPVRERYPMLFLTARAPGHSELPVQLFLDLAEANRRQLLDAGVKAKSIHVSPLCTACRTDLLFSYRKEKGITGRMLAAVGIRA